MRSIRAAAMLVAGVLLVAACGGAGQGVAGEATAGQEGASGAASPPASSPPSSPPSSASASPSSGTASAAAVVPAALKFSAKTLDGQGFEGASLAGRPVVFWFWAPWCPKCRSEAPAVKAAAARYGEVAFVGVAGLDTEPAMKEFVQTTGTGGGGIVHLSDAKGAVWTKLGVSAQSTFVFMKPDGSTRKATGPLDQAKLDEYLRALLGR
ncbi:redoxin domain-containing protein [Nonomuraea sp. MTCD27]|uniref:redoxin domain-containing protein n=1 Tax=Nonomuraea sp. MTCD27 TaxID=1676747 RepID=UPI0035C04837